MPCLARPHLLFIRNTQKRRCPVSDYVNIAVVTKKAIDVALRPYYASHLVLLLGAMLEDPGELVVVEHPVLDGRLAVHLVHLIVGEPECCLIQSVVRTGGVCSPVPDGGEQLPQSVLVQHPDIVLVKTPECVLDDVLGIRSLQLIYKLCDVFYERCLFRAPSSK